MEELILMQFWLSIIPLLGNDLHPLIHSI